MYHKFMSQDPGLKVLGLRVAGPKPKDPVFLGPGLSPDFILRRLILLLFSKTVNAHFQV